ncbi:MAG TPA: sugar ABC transporter permease [Treponema sp.]|mgnify:CR=1 FL=1|nr:sugar ABC transporter permease [Treponema sp.]
MKSRRKFEKRDFVLFSWTILPVFLYIVLFIAPIGIGINYSFTDWNGLASNYKYVGIKNFIQLFTTKRTLQSLKFTGEYAFFLVIAVMVLSMLLTLALTYAVSPRQRTFFRSMIFFPAVLSMVTIGLTWNQIFYRVLPQLGKFLNIESLSRNVLGSPDTAMWGVLFVNVWQGTAIPFVILLAGIQNVPKDLYESAKIDGAGSLRIFSNITIPFMIPSINVAFVMVLKNGITVFDYIQAMTEGGPMRCTESAGYLIYQLAFSDCKAGFASAYAILLLLLIGVISVVQMKISSKIEVGQL